MFWHKNNTQNSIIHQPSAFDVIKEIRPSATLEKTLGVADTAWLLGALNGGNTSDSGVVVNKYTAVRDPAVLACVKLIGEDVAKVPFYLWEKKGDKQEHAVKHPLYDLLRRKPNRWQCAFEFWEYFVHALVICGNSYTFMRHDGLGNIVELIPIEPSRVQILESENGMLFYMVSRSGVFENSLIVDHIIPQEFMWHVRGLPSGNGLLGASVISWGRDAIGLSLSQQKHASNMAKHGSKFAGTLNSKGKIGPIAAERLRQQWKNTYSGISGSGMTPVLEEGISFEPLQMSAVDAQFLEQRKLSLLDTARMFRVYPTKLMDLSKSTYSNVEQEASAHVTDTMMPYYEKIENSFLAHVLTDKESKHLKGEFFIKRLLRADTKNRFEAHAKAIANGMMNANEARDEEGLNPYEGGQYFRAMVNTGVVQEDGTLITSQATEPDTLDEVEVDEAEETEIDEVEE